MTEVNIWAVVVAAIASMVVGSIWYGPLFGKMFSELMGFNKLSPEQQAEMKKGMTKLYVVQFISSLVMFYVLACFISRIDLGDISAVKGAVFTGLLAWLGFILTTQLGNALWGGKMKLFWLGAGNSLVTVVVGALILGLWK